MSPIYGIVAQDTGGASGAPSTPNTYVANAVTFNGSTSLTKASITSTNNAFFSFAGWFKTDWTANTFPTGFLFDPGNQYGPFLQGEGTTIQFLVSSSIPNSTWLETSATSSPGNSTAWTHIIGSIDAQTHVGSLYFNDTLADATLTGVSGINVSTNGLQFMVGGDTFSGDEFIGDMCDLSIWPGVSFLTGSDITLTTRRFFRDSDGKPMDPAIYIAEFGTPPIMLSGNATNFLTNALGSSGSMSYYAGTLTNAATHP